MLIGYHRSHEASVAVFDDAGRPQFAASEERFTRVKMQGGWPRLTAEVWSASSTSPGRPPSTAACPSSSA